MSDLFGSDSLFIDFDKQSSNAVAVADNDKEIQAQQSDCVPSRTTARPPEKKSAVIKLKSGQVFEDYCRMKLPADSPHVSSLAALDDRPNYSSIFRDPLAAVPDPIDDGSKPPQRPQKPKLSCFNCGGAHMLSGCQQPKDYGRIAQKRREFTDANPPPVRPNPAQHSSNAPNGDYGSDTRQLPPLMSFEHFKPGTISNVLRHALGLYPNQIPPYVYILRVMGYPPGWLEEAKVPLGSGEVSDVPLFNPKLIVEYPGFNAKLPSEVADESRHFNVPRMDSQHSAKAMRHWMEALQQHHEQRRSVANRKQSDTSSQKHSHAKATVDVSGGEMAMDLDDTSDNEPTFQGAASSSAIVLSEDSSSRGSDGVDVEAVDVEYLEREREKLLRLLESTLSGNTVQKEGNSQSNETAEEDCVDDNDVDPSGRTTPPTQDKQSTSQSLGVSTGTPLPEFVNVPAAVPNREKFASGIGLHLPFQNLEGSVGTFERLQRVLAGIRKRQVTTSGLGAASSSGLSASVPSLNSGESSQSNSNSRDNSSGNRRNRSMGGYVDYDNPQDGDGRSRSKGSGNSRHSIGSHPQTGSSHGHSSEPRSSPHNSRYRPY